VTTILADMRLGVMVSDSSVSDGDRVWLGRKVRRYQGALFGFSGDCDEAENFMAWYKRGQTGKPPKFAGSYCLILSPSGLFSYSLCLTPMAVDRGYDAIGSGAKAAVCAYEALGFEDPQRAVSIVCKHDAGSRSPVRTYRL